MFVDSVMGRPLQTSDITLAANKLGVSEAHVRSVIDVEAGGAGFVGTYEDNPRLPKILFEAHIFSHETGGRYDDSHPTLSSKSWNRGLYAGGILEHDRLRSAAELDFEAAYRATSWGMFQIPGLNHEAAGYSRVLDFVGTQFVSEGLQLLAGVQFILSNRLNEHLANNHWAAFARGYNGNGYKQNRYGEKLAAVFLRLSHEQELQPDDVVKAVQEALIKHGFSVSVDGKWDQEPKPQ